MNITDQSVKDALHASIAKTILEGINQEQRDALLQKSIEEVLKDYSFKKAINEVIAEQAVAAAREIISQPEWKDRITSAIIAGFNNYLVHLSAAAEKSLQQMFHGTQGTDVYTRNAGDILKFFPQSE